MLLGDVLRPDRLFGVTTARVRGAISAPLLARHKFRLIIDVLHSPILLCVRVLLFRCSTWTSAASKQYFSFLQPSVSAALV